MKQTRSMFLAALGCASALSQAVWAQSADSSAAVLESASNSTEQVLATACGPRIRKSWDRLLPAEKSLYLRAIARAMDDGLYIKFVEIHTEQMSTSEAHRTCMFIYWHRFLLLGFENMLRAYGGEFACITMPYWNYVDHSALYLSGQCGSMESCSPILRELGGSVAGSDETVTINGTPIEGTCVAVEPCNHFCEASHLRGDQCAHCVPRGEWSSTPLPATTTVSSLMRQLFSTPTIAAVATNLEQGVHNTVHNALSGAMGYLEAPADPIFYSHHTAIDLLHSIYYKCVVGDQVPLSLQQKLLDPRVFTQCARRTPLTRGFIDSNVLMPESIIMARTGEDGENAASVFNTASPLDPFFVGLPTEYMSLSDIRDIGAFSYNYELTGLMAEMYTNCAGVAQALGTATRGVFRDLESKEQEEPVNSEQKEAKSTSGLVEAVVIPSQTSSNWYYEALQEATAAVASVGATQQEEFASALQEVEKMTCLFVDQCRGKVRDYSDSFRQNFHVTQSTPCRKIVDDVAAGRDSVRVPKWKEVMERHLKCESE